MNDNIRNASAAIVEAGNQLFRAQQKLLDAAQSLEDEEAKDCLLKIYRKIEASMDKTYGAGIELGGFFPDVNFWKKADTEGSQ